MADRPRMSLAEMILWVLLVALCVALLTGCEAWEASRSYTYETEVRDDGVLYRKLQIDVCNSDVTAGALKVTTKDGITVELSDLSAQERMTRAMEIQQENLKAILDKVPGVLP